MDYANLSNWMDFEGKLQMKNNKQHIKTLKYKVIELQISNLL